ncbi:MAG: OmpA family protein [Bacteroidales bacterium]
MHYVRKVFLLLGILLTGSILFAQNYTTDSKRAIRFYEDALRNFQRMQYQEAEDDMLRAIKVEEDFIEAHLVLAEIYLTQKKTDQAIARYAQALEIDPDFFPPAYSQLGDLYRLQEEFDKAMEAYETYLDKGRLSQGKISQVQQKMEQVEFAREAMANPVPFEPRSLGDSINSQYDEYWPSLTADESTLVITRLVPKDQKRAMPDGEGMSDAERRHLRVMTKRMNQQEDFYISHKVDSTWSEAVNAGEPLNTPEHNEGAQAITVDGQWLYFTACSRDDGVGSCDIYRAKNLGNQWGEVENLGKPLNSTTWDAHPSISPDGKYLYFSSARGGGKGGKDLWMARIKADGTFEKPVNMGDSINTRGEEMAPYIHPDNKTLYFTSSGWLGMGGLDLFKSTRDSNGKWSTPKNLGYPINTVNDEMGLIVNAKGNVAYYSTDREPANGKDIYAFDLYQEARPQPVSYMKGRVYDKDTRRPLAARFELIDLATEDTIMIASSKPETGQFIVCIPTNRNYALNVDKQNYLFYSDNFQLKGVYEATKPFSKDIPLQKIRTGERIVLRNIFFETDAYQLKEESSVELQKVIAFLEKNPSLKVEISGHTDNVGSDTYNQELSENRALSVFNYLLDKGIAKNRLTYKGYGESDPIATNDTEEGRAKNRRTEMKILEK